MAMRALLTSQSHAPSSRLWRRNFLFIFATIVCVLCGAALFRDPSSVDHLANSPIERICGKLAAEKHEQATAILDMRVKILTALLNEYEQAMAAKTYDELPAAKSFDELAAAKAYDDVPAAKFKEAAPSLLPCAELEGAQDILVIMKTGATEAHLKLPQHFATTFRCIPHFVIYSDLEEEINGHLVLDALDGIDLSIQDAHDDFALYRLLQDAQEAGRNITEVLLSSKKDDEEDHRGWNLDKWKFLPLLDKAYQTKPDAKWYVFIEADTFLMWSNIVRYLSFLDPSEPHYRGGPAWVGGHIFAHGGSGYILSQATMSTATEALHENLTYYYGLPEEECCGDLVLALFLARLDINFTSAYPLIQGETPMSLDYGREKWCRPVLSYHHVDSDTIEAMWRFEQKWLGSYAESEEGLAHDTTDSSYGAGHDPPVHHDVYNHFIAPIVASARLEDWDNLSHDKLYTTKKDDHKDPMSTKAQRLSPTSLEACRKVCLDDEDCKQYAYRPGECRLGNQFRVGNEATGESEGLRSRWLLDRMDSIREESMEACKGQSYEKMFHTEN